MGKLKQIWIKRSRLGPMDEAESAELVAGSGLLGNANQGGRRQVTLIDWGAWQEMALELGADVDPSLRRANLLLDGIPLADTRGFQLNIGDARLVIQGETRPCERMEQAQPGLQQVMRPEWRGGVYAVVVRGGAIRVGDRVTLCEESEPSARPA